MGILKGAREWERFEKGQKLTVKQAVKAHCFSCNGFEDGSGDDCLAKKCVLKPFFDKWNKKRVTGKM